MKTKLPFKALLGLGAFFFASQAEAQTVTTFDYTGAVQTYTVPFGVTSIQIETWGGSGELETVDDYVPSSGGLGGYAIGELSVTPGDVLNIYVGGEGTPGVGGWNGGGTGGLGTAGSGGTTGYGGSGGGASDVRVGGTALGDRVIVAGGGGGGGRNYTNGTCVPCGEGGDGGNGGGLSGDEGLDPTDPTYGIYFNAGAGADGGTSVAGGAGGAGTEGTPGNSGALGIGGDGINASQGAGSGAGGGGYYGGGAGAGPSGGSGAAGGGGAGGSSYIGGVLAGSTSSGVNSGNGIIVITELCTPLSVEISSDTLCFGEELTLSAFSGTGGSIVWDGDVEDGVSFVPDGSGDFTYTATSDSDDDCAAEIEIYVHEDLEIVVEPSPSELCFGESLVFETDDAPGIEYEWPEGIEEGVPFTPEMSGTIEYVVIGTNTMTMCEKSETVTIIVNDLPEITATADEESYCDGDEITLSGAGGVTYTWDMGVEDGVPFTQEIGTETYTVIGSSDEGCENEASIDVTVNANPEISATTSDELFGGDGSIDLTVDAGVAPYTFDWDNDGTGDFDDAEDLTGLSGGTYTVVMMDENGCTATLTLVVDTQLSLDEDANMTMRVYPNPTVDFVTITLDDAFAYQLVNLTGDVVLSGNGAQSEELDLSNLANGVYLLRVSNENIEKTVKVIRK